MSILKAFAEADAKAVPVVRKNRVRVERDGVSVTEGVSRAGTGNIPYAEVVVNRIRKVRRGFVNERYVVNIRRNERAGSCEETVVKRDEASGAIGYAAALDSSRNRFLRL